MKAEGRLIVRSAVLSQIGARHSTASRRAQRSRRRVTARYAGGMTNWLAGYGRATSVLPARSGNTPSCSGRSRIGHDRPGLRVFVAGAPLWIAAVVFLLAAPYTLLVTVGGMAKRGALSRLRALGACGANWRAGVGVAQRVADAAPQRRHHLRGRTAPPSAAFRRASDRRTPSARPRSWRRSPAICAARNARTVSGEPAMRLALRDQRVEAVGAQRRVRLGAVHLVQIA